MNTILKSSVLTGVFIDKAQELVPKEPATEEQLLSRWAATVKDAQSFGLTSIHDAGFSPVSLKFFKRYDGTQSFSK
jgi:predicted amidohydrolase YtcJ